MAQDLDFERSIYSHQAAAAPSTAGTLFETYGDRVVRRVAEVLNCERCPWPPTSFEMGLLFLLGSHIGRANSVPLNQLAELMHLDARKIKEMVQGLRLNFGVQIGALRTRDGGYYLISSDEESLESHSYLVNQAVSMLRTARALRPQQTIAELAGQLTLELGKELPHGR